MIKLPTVQRADITDGFKEPFRQLYKDLYKKLERELETAPSYARQRIEQGKKAQMVRIYQTLTDREAFDMAMTKLRLLDYIKFDVYEHKGVQYLWCITKPAIARYEHHQNVTDKNGVVWHPPFDIDLGPYWIFVPQNDIVSGNINGIHFVPERDKKTLDRHMHHYAVAEYDPQTYRQTPVENPLDCSPSTCWGTFPGIVTGCMNDGDIVELLRTLQLFTVRLAPHSPLRHLESIMFCKGIVNENQTRTPSRRRA